MSLTSLLNISSSSLLAYQQALSVTSNNIANANNANYSRQKVVLSANTSNSGKTGILGAGVTMQNVTRVKDNLIDSQLRQYYSQNSSAAKQSTYLSQVESLTSEPGEQGLSSLMNKFYSSWNDLSVNPESVALRQSVLQSTQQVSNKLQGLYEGIQRMKPDLMSEATSTVNSVNDNLKTIQTLNKQIFEAKASGNDANDLMDKRDEAINTLSKSVNINVSFDKENTATISLGGIIAVDKFNVLQFKAVEENGQMRIKTTDSNNSATIQGGDLGAVSQLYNTVLPGLTKKLDDTGRGIVDSVNKLHSSGYTNQKPPTTGVPFFEGYSNGILKINSAITGDLKNIAISADGSSANNSIALQIAAAKDTKLDNGLTVSDTYAGFVNDIGTGINSADQSTESSSSVIMQLENQKASYSGVSVDEEMVNILKFQRSYDASAKLIKVASDLFDALLQAV